MVGFAPAASQRTNDRTKVGEIREDEMNPARGFCGVGNCPAVVVVFAGVGLGVVMWHGRWCKGWCEHVVGAGVR